MRPARVLLSLAATSLLSACGLPFVDEGISCTDEFIASTRITVVDSGGAVQDDARVTFVHEGQSETDAWCAHPGIVAGSCVEWETPDEGGTYVLRATSADGQRTAQKQVEVDADVCHVEETVPVQLVLPD